MTFALRQSTLNWSPAKRSEQTICVDELGHSLVVRGLAGGIECVIPFSRCTDVRLRPYDDETAAAGPLDLTKVRAIGPVRHVSILGTTLRLVLGFSSVLSLYLFFVSFTFGVAPSLTTLAQVLL